VGKEFLDEHHHLIVQAESTKLAKLNEMLESIRESGDKVAVFTHWTNLTLHLIRDKIEVPHVVHWGVGQSEIDSQAAKDRFMTDPDITCFLSSDAGSHGLNLQCARYVIQYEPTYSYDDAMQRASRIDRADSHLDGLTNYVMVTESSVEQRVWNIQQDRRIISAATQGTEEVLSYGSNRALLSETENLPWLIFGDRML
jgi:SNF2 family DNA or RNA helicase